MDEIYDERPARSWGALVINLLTALVLLSTLCAGAGMVAVFVNPGLVEAVDPFIPGLDLQPPPTLPAILGWPTATNTPEIYLPASWTPTVTETAGPTSTPIPTQTPMPTDTPTPPAETYTPTPTGLPFSIQPGSPIYMANSFVNALGCDWMGVGGQVFDTGGAPIVGLSVHLEGQLGGQPIDLTALTGSAVVLGPSGYVFDLSDRPTASQGTLWLQLQDTAGLELSDQLFLTTYESCEQNFMLVNWRQVR